MTQKIDKIYSEKVHFRQITERFCSHTGDNVVIMQTVTDTCERFQCMNSEGCPNRDKCKINV